MGTKEQRREYEFALTRNTTVEKDLRITSDDAVEFLLAYAKKFDVDVSHFMAADYFLVGRLDEIVIND